MATSLSYNELVKLLKNGKIKLHELEKYGSAKESAKARAQFLIEKTKIEIKALLAHSLNAEQTSGNIENFFGAVQVPVGVAGPLKLKGSFYRGEPLIPLATTEGALVASVNRGASAITKSGGANVKITKDLQTRAPLLECSSPKAALELASYVMKNEKELKKIGEDGSKHTKIIDFELHLHDGLAWLKIKATTGDAMGMNMISIAAEKICEHIEQKVNGVKYLSVSGNLCIDKKPSGLIMKEGRGKSALASVTIPRKTVQEVLKTTPEEMEKLNNAKNIIGASIAQSYGQNAHFANVAAAIFLATGQDMAHVVEASHGTTRMIATSKGLEVSVSIPALLVGTVGGGTSLPSQKESIRLMGIKGKNQSSQLAEIIAVAMLAGEISLMAALCSKQLVKAHEKLNRKPR